ncbi:MAG: SlyX protein [Rhodobacterales bacterium]|nr:MAG: SlyX protein [Rhodobacterales bacterium]
MDEMTYQEKIAHLERVVDELSDVVARQDAELVLLKRQVRMLVSREADREAAGSGGVILGDERPPHY